MQATTFWHGKPSLCTPRLHAFTSSLPYRHFSVHWPHAAVPLFPPDFGSCPSHLLPLVPTCGAAPSLGPGRESGRSREPAGSTACSPHPRLPLQRRKQQSGGDLGRWQELRPSSLIKAGRVWGSRGEGLRVTNPRVAGGWWGGGWRKERRLKTAETRALTHTHTHTHD